jgi:hypothetical protein
MRISKISSKSTYHKCLKNLHSLGYISYEPSYNPFKGSIVYLFNFSEELKPTPKNEKNTSSKNDPLFGQVNGQVVDKLCTSSGTGTGQALVSYINNTNIPNISNDLNFVNRQAQKNKNKNSNDFLETKTQNQKKKLREKKDFDGNIISNKREGSIPNTDEIKNYFLEKNSSELEAEKFYNYFQSNGWLVGGKSKMKDWKAAARNWMLNSEKFSNKSVPQLNHLHVPNHKNYSEPL